MFAGNTTANTINHVTKNRLAGNAANNSYQDINSKAKCANKDLNICRQRNSVTSAIQ